MTPAASPHPGHPNPLLEAVDRLLKAVSRLPQGIATATRSAGGRATSSLPDLSRLADAVEKGFRRATARDAPARKAASKAVSAARMWSRRTIEDLSRHRTTKSRAWAKAVGAMGRSWARRRGNLARALARRRKALGRSWARRRKAFGRSWATTARDAGRIWRRNRRRASALARRHGRGPARRVGARGGIGGLEGPTARGMGGAILPALDAVIKAGKAIERFAEGVNASNRSLAPFSGQLQAAFARLQAGDLRRKMALARFDEGAGANLADQVDRLRDAGTGLAKFRQAVGNRLALAGAKLIGPGMKSIDDAFGDLAAKVLGMDPDGKKMADGIDSIFSGTTGLAGFAMSLLGGNGWDRSLKAWDDASKQWAIDQQAAGKAHGPEGWDLFLKGARQMPALAPPRDWKW